VAITNRKIRLGFIGCGRISKKHFEVLHDLRDEVEVVAIVDQQLEQAKQVAEEFGAASYSDITEMLVAQKPDIVTVATPNGLHPEHVMQVARAGCHVITEKPMAIKWKDGLRMKQVCDENKVKLFVIHQNRFNDPVQALWRAISEGRFGKIYMITSNVFWQRPQEYYGTETSWHGTKNMDGGAFMTQASHYVDLMQWVAQSKPKSVFANIATLAREIETEDTGMAIIEWQNGVRGAINMTVLTYPKNLEGSVTILGEKGLVKIGGVAMNKIEHWDFADKQPYDQEVLAASYDTDCVYGNGHIRNYKNIFAELRGEEKALIDGEQGLASLEILCAIYDSAAVNSPISLPYPRLVELPKVQNE
jgi:UDP-N-acetyl-2-amino-2-deoxyglucuronate dehydrogenase